MVKKIIKKIQKKLWQGGKRGSANIKQAGSANSQKEKIVKYANSPTKTNKTNKPKSNQIKKQQSKVSKSEKT